MEGLQVQSTGQGADTALGVSPGQAVGAQGRLLRLFYPLREAWTDLVAQVERDDDAALANGIYFLTLRTGVEAIDQPTDAEPCTRTEPDPLRDRRLETVSLLGLRLVSANPRILAMSPQRAANRLCARFLSESPFDPRTGTVPLALVKVVDKKPEWIDAVAGRYLAEPNAEYETFLAHTMAALEDFLQNQAASLHETPVQFVKRAPAPLGIKTFLPRLGIQPFLPSLEVRTLDREMDVFLPLPRPLTPLAQVLDLDYLPAAGPFPVTLLKDPAGAPPQLNFRPGDLQVDLVPVPASTVESVVAMELPRGKVDLVHGLGERIRLLLAIPDLDYRHDLFDLPQRDLALEDELFRRGWSAYVAYGNWLIQWQHLFNGLTAEQQSRIKPPLVSAEPREPGAYRNDLVSRRRAALDNPDTPLPEPYRSHLASPNPAPAGGPPDPPVLSLEDGLFRQREDLFAAITSLQAEVDEGNRLLSELGDFNTLQRQHLDALSVSFSALAGGISGDGKGLDLIRKSKDALFVPKGMVASLGGGA